MRLSDMSGFHHESSMPVNTDDTKFVLTDPYHFMLVGGDTPNWSGTSTSNWFRWNAANLRVVRTEAQMLYTHQNAPAVAVPVNKARIKNCAEPYALPPP